MKFPLALIISGLLSGSIYAASTTEYAIQQEKLSWQNLVRVKAKNYDEFVKLSISHHSEMLESDADALTVLLNVSDKQLSLLQQVGLSVELDENWKQKRLNEFKKILSIPKAEVEGIPGYSCYPTVEETFSEASSLASQYSNLAKWIDVGDSWKKTQNQGGYDMMVLKITNQNINGDKPVLFVHSAMHAREYTTAALNLEFAKKLLNEYESDADARMLVDHHEIHLMFHMNPDGRKHAETGVLWRKNDNTSYCAASSPGVDLNRNFSYFWNSTNGQGSSGNQCDQTYRGPSPGSEPETQAVENYIRSIFPDVRGDGENDAAPATTPGMHIDLHSYSELVLWPWGHTDVAAPNGVALQTLGRRLAWFNNYYPTQSVGLYPTDGTSDEVSYGELGIANITFELGKAFFESCTEFNLTVKPENLNALYYAAKISRAPYLLPSGPEIIQLSGNDNRHAVIAKGEALSVKASATDTRFNNRNGSESTQNISQVYAYIDSPPWNPESNALSMTADDGGFDENSEAVSIDLNTEGWADGEHILYFQGHDSSGSKGPVSAMLVTIGDNANPEARFTYSCTELACQFDATTSSDDGDILQYQWNFGDSSSLNGATVSHTFSQSGSYSVSLTVIDNLGSSGEQTQNISVSQSPQEPDDSSRSSSGGGALFSLIFVLFLGFRRR